MGRAAGHPAARGAWANSKLLRLSQNYRDRSADPTKLKQTSKANTVIQAITIIGVPGLLESLRPEMILSEWSA
jgi:hypothetical protein